VSQYREMKGHHLTPTTNVLLDIERERIRQLRDEGWSLEHDDKHDAGELADAAACYAICQPVEIVRQFWPWEWAWWKPTNKRRNLVKAGALIVAEIERLDRVEKGLKRE